MARTQYTPPAATDHYHISLGAFEGDPAVAPSGSTPTLEQVLATGNDPGAHSIQGATVDGGAGGILLVDPAPGAGAGGAFTVSGGLAAQSGSNASGGNVYLSGGQGWDGEAGVEPGSISVFGGQSNGSKGVVGIYTDGTYGNEGDILVAANFNETRWVPPTVPTLAEVLAAGNDPAGTWIAGDNTAVVRLSAYPQVIDTDTTDLGGYVELNPTAETAGGNALIAGGDGWLANHPGGYAVIAGGMLHTGTAAPLFPASITVYGGGDPFGAPDGAGRIEITTDGRDGAPGEVLTADESGLNYWSALCTVQNSAPTTYVTPLVFDNTASTGGLYVWAGSSYSKIGAATS